MGKQSGNCHPNMEGGTLVSKRDEKSCVEQEQDG